MILDSLVASDSAHPSARDGTFNHCAHIDRVIARSNKIPNTSYLPPHEHERFATKGLEKRARANTSQRDKYGMGEFNNLSLLQNEWMGNNCYQRMCLSIVFKRKAVANNNGWDIARRVAYYPPGGNTRALSSWDYISGSRRMLGTLGGLGERWIICVAPVVPVGRSLRTGDEVWEYWILKGGDGKEWR